MKYIDGKETANEIKADLYKEVKELEQTTKLLPHLVCVVVGNNPASEAYVKNKVKSCEDVGIISEVIRLDESTTEEELLDVINKLNFNISVSGFIVQLPLPKHINEQKIIAAINPEKDVDGFTPINLGKVMLGEDCFTPATPLGIIDLLNKYDIATEGRSVLIIGRSNIVGKPMANILMNKPYNANVTVMHSKSGPQNLYDAIEHADIIIAAVGIPKFVNHCKPGAVLIDVGINRVDGKLVGDVDFDAVKHFCGGISPVPGGVGPMTACSLLKNTIKAFKNNYENN